MYVLRLRDLIQHLRAGGVVDLKRVDGQVGRASGAHPDEHVNLYQPDHPALPQLQRALETWLARANSLRDERSPEVAAEPSAEDQETLRALGYIE